MMEFADVSDFLFIFRLQRGIETSSRQQEQEERVNFVLKRCDL